MKNQLILTAIGITLLSGVLVLGGQIYAWYRTRTDRLPGIPADIQKMQERAKEWVVIPTEETRSRIPSR